MKEILDDLDRWLTEGLSISLARVVDIEGSGPRLPGATMAVNELGEVAGSVSGGCVEGAVVTEALDVIAGGGRRLVTFGYSDDDAFAVGLTCGGTVHLFIEPVVIDDTYRTLRDALRSQRAVALATVVEGAALGATLLLHGDVTTGSLGDANLDRVVTRDLAGELAAARSGVRHYGNRGEAGADDLVVFIETFAPPPRMLIFGAVDFTAALVRVAKVLGYDVTVCDARETFATPRRFPLADHVVVDWPHRLLDRIDPGLGPNDAVCVLTHDHKFDVPAIVAALATPVGYLGAMGSRRTAAQRRQLLVDAGVEDSDLERVMAPIGLDLGARTPEEAAISICAEIIALRTGRSAASLSNTDGPLHDSGGPGAPRGPDAVAAGGRS